MSSLSPSLSRVLPLPRTPRAAAFGQVVLNEARLVRRQPTNMIGSIGLPVVLTIIFGELPSFPPVLAGLWRAHLVRRLRADHHGARAHHARPARPARARSSPTVSWASCAACRPPRYRRPGCSPAAGRRAAVHRAGRPADRERGKRRRFRGAGPKSPGGLALSCLLAIGGLFALGLLIAALAPTANSVKRYRPAGPVPLLFFAGLWLPRAIMPAVLQDISNYTPLGAAGVEAIQDSVQTGDGQQARGARARRGSSGTGAPKAGDALPRSRSAGRPARCTAARRPARRAARTAGYRGGRRRRRMPSSR